MCHCHGPLFLPRTHCGGRKDSDGGSEDRSIEGPVTKRDVRAFLGLAGYYCHFVPGFAQLTARISDLTRKEEPPKVNWTAQHEEDFQKLKALMCNKPILHCPDESREFLLQSDASERGIGAVLSQMTEEGVGRPVAFFSRKLLPRETHYSTVEKECLGVDAALKHTWWEGGSPLSPITRHCSTFRRCKMPTHG